MARELPPHLSDPLCRCCESACSFIALHEENATRMRAIVQELSEISDQVKEMHGETYTSNVTGGLVIGGGLLITYLARRTAVREGAGDMAILPAILVGGALVIAGCRTVFKSNTKETVAEKESIKKVEQLGTEFMTIVEGQKNFLEEIKKVSDELEENSSFLKTTAGAQAQTTLSEIGEFMRFLRRMKELQVDFKARDFISELASQCGKTVDEVAKIRSKLRDFEESNYAVPGPIFDRLTQGLYGLVRPHTS